jgi:predicted hydrocarbon binding protein
MYNPSAFAMENSTDNTKITDKQPNISPSHMGWVFQQALEEILGQSGGNIQQDFVNFPAQIKCNHSQHEFSNSCLIHISHLQASLESAYGSRAGHGLAVRIGRACLKYALREFGTELGLTELAFRLLPLQAKLTTATEAFAQLFNTCTDQKIRLEGDQRYIDWIIERCPLCWESRAEGPGCHLAMGFLQEALFWASGGKNFEIAEKQYVTTGNAACIIQIDRIPMG